jgi:hypothetical protein
VSRRGQVSVRGETYARLKIEAEVRNKSIAQLVEELVEASLRRPTEVQAVDSPPQEG